MFNKIISHGLIFAGLVLLLAACDKVTTDVVPVYDIRFIHSNSTLTQTTGITFTRVSDSAVFDYSTQLVSAAGEVAKEQTFGNVAVNQQFPEYVEVLLIQPGATYTTGFGCDACLRFRFKSNMSSGATLTVAQNNDSFWINEDIFDNFDQIAAESIQIQYVEDTSAGGGTRSWWTATGGTATLIEKVVTPSDSKNGDILLKLSFDNIPITVAGVDYLLNGAIEINANPTDNNI